MATALCKQLLTPIQKTTINYDSLWRPVLVKTEDTSSGWASYLKSSFDQLNRKVFESYPSLTSNPTAGTTTVYDALGRTTSVSEPGAAPTTYNYLSSHRRQVTDREGNATTSWYDGYDGPELKDVVRIDQPSRGENRCVSKYLGRNLVRTPTQLSTRY